MDDKKVALGVVGSRSFEDEAYLVKAIDGIRKQSPIGKIVSGGAKGVDKFAEDYATRNKIPKDIIKPDYQKYAPHVAPIMRNTTIVERIDKLLAIWDQQSPGTQDTIQKARDQGKYVKLHTYKDKTRKLDFNNPDIITRKPEKGELATLRKQKKELSEEGYPVDKTFEAVKDYYLKAKKQFSTIPNKAHLFVMPSTSGKNIIPLILAKMIQADKPGITLHNVGPDKVSVPVHIMESKNKGRYADQMEDKREFQIKDGAGLDALKGKKNVYLIDDLVSTGESSIVMKKSLEQKGVKLTGVVAALSSDRSFARERDLERLYEYLNKQKPQEMSSKKLKEDITEVFGGFPRRKLTGFEIDLHRKKEFKESKKLAFDYIRENADYYRSLKPENALKENKQLSAKDAYLQKVKERTDKLLNKNDDKHVHKEEIRQRKI